tara:strand:+ start:700 stop:1278 length:579 start_codon:yes stop_codon:yes gene_type:complete
VPIFDLRQPTESLIASCLRARDEGLGYAVIIETHCDDTIDTASIYNSVIGFNTIEELCLGSFSNEMRSSSYKHGFIKNVIDLNADIAEQFAAREYASDSVAQIREEIDTYTDTLQSVSRAEMRIGGLSYAFRKLINKPPKDEADLQDLTSRFQPSANGFEDTQTGVNYPYPHKAMAVAEARGLLTFGQKAPV